MSTAQLAEKQSTLTPEMRNLVARLQFVIFNDAFDRGTWSRA